MIEFTSLLNWLLLFGARAKCICRTQQPLAALLIVLMEHFLSMFVNELELELEPDM